MELAKAYQASDWEDKIYKQWLEQGIFNPDVCIEKGITSVEAEYFSIVLPPPNVTGTLHMGHAAMLAIEDVMVRYNRMQGKRTLWLPGTDHAAIATQSKVEKILKEETGQSRHDLGREKFLAKVDEFAQNSHDTIVNQSKKMGASLDWSREAFTLDEQRNLAVKTVFKKMYEDGLIYRGDRIVNWDPKGQTVISDDEIVHEERQGKLYTFKYSADFPITISTTRPETKVGDTAVAVHPDDKRYAEYVGKTYKIDNFCGVSLEIKIIADEAVEPEFGTGALGVTPAHSQIDADMATRHDLPSIQVINEKAEMMVGEEILNKSTLEAREIIVQWLRDNNLLENETEVTQNVSTAERTGEVIEPLPKLQWFIDVNQPIQDRDNKTLKQLMLGVVENDDIKIIPERFEKIYFNWINNLRDWCISRQIWYGHRIPVWYRGEEVYVGIEAPEGDDWEQDSDTLDTWFSSGLWTFSTLGYPDLEAADFKNYHPTTVMETGYDIIFFWVARMILMSTYILGDIPFENVYLHGLVRDENGKKMSKSLGNVIDPLDMIEKYGADATRLSLMIGTTPGNDMKLSEDKVAGYRNFVNKLWNISRYILMTVAEAKYIETEPEAKTLADQWILAELNNLVQTITNDIDKYNFSAAGEKLYDFTWNKLADWYVEIAKIEKDKDEVLLYVLQTLLKLWHPFTPFVTEVIWENFNTGNQLVITKWPEAKDVESETKEFKNLQQIITNIRKLRINAKIMSHDEVDVFINAIDQNTIGVIKNNINVVEKMSKVKVNLTNPDKGTNTKSKHVLINIHESKYSIHMHVSENFNQKQAKEKQNLEKYIDTLRNKLEHSDFAKKAPENVVEQERQKLQEAEEKLKKM